MQFLRKRLGEANVVFDGYIGGFVCHDFSGIALQHGFAQKSRQFTDKTELEVIYCVFCCVLNLVLMQALATICGPAGIKVIEQEILSVLAKRIRVLKVLQCLYEGISLID